MNKGKFTLTEQFILTGVLLGFFAVLVTALFGHLWILSGIFLATAVLTGLFVTIYSRRLADSIPEQVLQQTENQNAIHQRQLQELSAELSEARTALAALREKAFQEQPLPDSHWEEERAQLTKAAILPPPSVTEKVNIIAVAESAIAALEPYAKASHIRLQLSAASESLVLTADSAWLKIMLLNIIDNSIKYMRQSGTLVITISKVGTDIFIVLKDNGAGLPESEVEHIFDINYQGSNRQSGNGLGLAQSKAIIDFYGGTVYAKSAQGRGMAIYIQLPLEAQQPVT